MRRVARLLRRTAENAQKALSEILERSRASREARLAERPGSWDPTLEPAWEPAYSRYRQPGGPVGPVGPVGRPWQRFSRNNGLIHHKSMGGSSYIPLSCVHFFDRRYFSSNQVRLCPWRRSERVNANGGGDWSPWSHWRHHRRMYWDAWEQWERDASNYHKDSFHPFGFKGRRKWGRRRWGHCGGWDWAHEAEKAWSQDGFFNCGPWAAHAHHRSEFFRVLRKRVSELKSEHAHRWRSSRRMRGRCGIGAFHFYQMLHRLRSLKSMLRGRWDWASLKMNLRMLMVVPTQFPPPKVRSGVASLNAVSQLLYRDVKDDSDGLPLAKLPQLLNKQQLISITALKSPLSQSSILPEFRSQLFLRDPWRSSLIRIVPETAKDTNFANSDNTLYEDGLKGEFQLPSLQQSIVLVVAVEFDLQPHMTGLATGLTDDFIANLSSSLQTQVQQLQVIQEEIAKLAELGELPISVSNGQAIRVHFPNCDLEKVQLLLEDKGVTHGRIVEVPTVMPEVPPPPSTVASSPSLTSHSFSDVLSSIRSSWNELLADVPELSQSATTVSMTSGSIVTI